MPTEVNVKHLKINRLTEEQYATAVKNENELYLTPDNTDQEIADAVSAHNSSASAHSTLFSGKQNTLATQTAYTSKGSATKVPQITTNTLGQVTGITEVDISYPDQLPSQIEQSGKFLTTNGSTVSWANASSVKFREWYEEMALNIVGSPTITSGVVSGFSYYNFLTTQEVFDTSKDFEIVLKANTGTMTNNEAKTIFKNKYGSGTGSVGFSVVIGWQSGQADKKKIKCWIYNENGSTIVNGTVGNTILQNNTVQKIKNNK